MLSATYVGRDYPALRGKTAIFKACRRRDLVLVQFDETCYNSDGWRMDLNWWVFPATDFVLVPGRERAILFATELHEPIFADDERTILIGLKAVWVKSSVFVDRLTGRPL